MGEKTKDSSCIDEGAYFGLRRYLAFWGRRLGTYQDDTWEIQHIYIYEQSSV